ncbi:MAG TPA: RluA family pseudouridine synthase [Candidatus Babeliales bacterium]|nr:RluA family pseudouridine synthase [Candidatus Babeliales bacterium]
MNPSELITAGKTVDLQVELVDSQPIRIDTYLANQFARYSRSFFARLVHDAYITKNGKTISKPSTLVQLGDRISITGPDATADSPQELTGPLSDIKIVYTHPEFLIINKPAGVVVHKSSSYNQLPTLTDWLTAHYQEIAQVGSVDRPGIVHRLDKDTSGLMIIARTNYAHGIFTTLFKERAINKTYYALVEGHPNEHGIIDLAITRHPVHRKKMMASIANGTYGTIRTATTQYKVLQYYTDHTLIQAKPITGRTHQIRVHFAAIKHPLLGDTTYGKKSHLIAHHVLHAKELSFSFDGTQHTFSCELPPAFESLLNSL